MPITLDGTAGITTPAISGDAIATQAEAEAGTDNTKLMTPLRVEQSLVATVATQAEAEAGTDNTKLMSPLRAAQSVSRFVPDVENRIINGAFDFWQRGTSFTANAYGADRWINANSGGTVTMSRQSFTLGDTLGSNSPTFFLRQSASGQTLASHFALIRQRIEGVRSYAGQTITVLGWARRSSGSGNMVVEMEQNFGTGGSPSADVRVSPVTITLTDSWAPFAVTFTMSSITGKTLGSNGNDHLAIAFWTSAGSDYNARTNSLGLQTIGVDLWGIHIKVGTHTAAATDRYRQPELGPELARCQRYYQSCVATSVILAGRTSGTGTVLTGMALPVPLRAVPSVNNFAATVYSSSGVQASSGGSVVVHATDSTTAYISLLKSGFTNLTDDRVHNIFVTGAVILDAEL